MQDQGMQGRLQAALEACARMQDQRDEALADSRHYKMNVLNIAAQCSELKNSVLERNDWLVALALAADGKQPDTARPTLLTT